MSWQEEYRGGHSEVSTDILTMHHTGTDTDSHGREYADYTVTIVSLEQTNLDVTSRSRMLVCGVWRVCHHVKWQETT